MPKINKIRGRQVFDSRGNPTVEAELSTEDGSYASAIVPSGASTGTHEAFELRDKENKNYLGTSVLTAVKNINGAISKSLNNFNYKEFPMAEQAVIFASLIIGAFLMGVGRRQVAIAVTVILVAVVYVFITGISDTMVYYYNVSEVSERRAELVGDALRVHGQVVPGAIEKDTTGLVHKFLIVEGGLTVPVIYRDIVPDTFEDRADAVVEGSFDAAGTFQATFLMAKCPSKYEAETDYAQFRDAGVVAPAQSPAQSR